MPYKYIYEVALEYFPNEARDNAKRNLNYCLDMTPELVEQLKKLGYDRHRTRQFSPKMQCLIYKYLGEP